MKVEPYGECECMLAAIAALTNSSLADVRTIACALAGIDTWKDIFFDKFYDGSSKFKTVISTLEMVYGITYTQSETTLNGKGVVTVDGDGGYHIMPFEDGLVYDHPEQREPMPFDKLLNAGYRAPKIWICIIKRGQAHR